MPIYKTRNGIVETLYGYLMCLRFLQKWVGIKTFPWFVVLPMGLPQKSPEPLVGRDSSSANSLISFPFSRITSNAGQSWEYEMNISLSESVRALCNDWVFLEEPFIGQKESSGLPSPFKSTQIYPRRESFVPHWTFLTKIRNVRFFRSTT